LLELPSLGLFDAEGKTGFLMEPKAILLIQSKNEVGDRRIYEKQRV
jgi:hypothetical protein